MIAVNILHNLAKDMDHESERVRSNMEYALRRTAFAARSDLIMKMKTGALGLKELSTYRNPHGVKVGKKLKKPGRPPLEKLALRGILYRVDKASMTAELGFLGGTDGSDWQKRLAEKHLHGYKINIPPLEWKHLREKGILLRRETHEISVPARDPIGKYVEANRGRMLQSIKDVFDLKMKGGRA